MNILMILATKFPPQCRTEKESASLMKWGHNVHLVTINRGNEKPEETFKGIQVQRLTIEPQGMEKTFQNFLIKSFPFLKNKTHVLKTHKPIRDLISTYAFYNSIDKNTLWYKELEKIIINKDIDILHVHDIPSIRVSLALAKKHKLPVLLDMHENWPAAMIAHSGYKGIKGIAIDSLRKIYERVEKKACKHSDKIIVVVEENKTRLLRLGVPEDKVITIMNSVDSEHYDKNHNNQIKPLPKGYKILYSGTFGKHRGLELAIQSMPKILEKKQAHLVLVGDGPNTNELKALVKELKIENNVHFIGFVPYEHIPTYIKACDVCLVLHRINAHTDHTVPHKLFEYMYMNKPIIVTKAKPLERIIKETDCGKVINWDLDSFTQAAIELSDENKRKELIKKIKVDKYKWLSIEKEFKKVYNFLIEKRSTLIGKESK
jgi:glycosyltransferase involved in cell wall biosynthesis